MAPKGEGTQENAPDHERDGRLSEDVGDALDPLVGLVQAGHDPLDAIEDGLGGVDRCLHVLEPVADVHRDHPTVRFRHRDGTASRSNHALAYTLWGAGSGVEEVADRPGAVVGAVH